MGKRRGACPSKYLPLMCPPPKSHLDLSGTVLSLFLTYQLLLFFFFYLFLKHLLSTCSVQGPMLGAGDTFPKWR